MHPKMIRLFILFILLSSNALADPLDRPIERILNDVWDDSAGALNVSGGGVVSGDSATGDPNGILYIDSTGATLKTDPAFRFDDTSGGLQLGKSNGVQISGDTGVTTITSLSGTAEDLTITGTASNVVTISSTTSADFTFARNSTFSQLIAVPNDVSITLGGGDSSIQHDTADTNDTTKWGVVVGSATGSGNIAIVELADINTNFSYPLTVDPTVIFQGSDATQVLDRGTAHYESASNRFIVSADTGSVYLQAPQGVSVDTAIVGVSTTSVGWSIVDQTDNQACTTGCNYACMFGIQNSTGTAVTSIVDCADTTADLCACMGPN